MKEFQLINDLLKPLAKQNSGALNLGDDVALLPDSCGKQQIVSVDAIVEGVHFLPNDPPKSIAQKLLRVNLSDIAAKGGKPFGYFLTLALPKNTTRGWLQNFVRGLRQDQEAFNLGLLGGDTVVTPGPLTLSVTIIGQVDGKPLLRSGAKAGDALMIGGTLGRGYCGLRILQGSALSGVSNDDRTAYIRHYRTPEPQLDLGMFLQSNKFATAAMDVSDGVLADLEHLCSASNCGAKIVFDDIPVCTSLIDPQVLITGGDDYVLLFSADPKVVPAIEDRFPTCTRIGKIEKEPGIRLFNRDGKMMNVSSLGFQHQLYP